MTPTLTDEELALLEFRANEIHVSHHTTAVAMRKALAELRHLRSRGLSGEERDLIRAFVRYGEESFAPQPAVERALSVLARLVGES